MCWYLIDFPLFIDESADKLFRKAPIFQIALEKEFESVPLRPIHTTACITLSHSSRAVRSKFKREGSPERINWETRDNASALGVDDIQPTALNLICTSQSRLLRGPTFCLLHTVHVLRTPYIHIPYAHHSPSSTNSSFTGFHFLLRLHPSFAKLIKHEQS